MAIKKYILVLHYQKKDIDKTFNVYRLVAEQFLPNPKKYPCVNHKDGNRQNNTLNNLEWCSYSQNTKHSFDNLLQPYGEYRKDSKLTFKNVDKIRKLSKIKEKRKYVQTNNKRHQRKNEIYYVNKYTMRKLADMFGVDQGLIHRIIINKSWIRNKKQN